MMEILVLAAIPILVLVLLSLLAVTWNVEEDACQDAEEGLRQRCPNDRETAVCIRRIFSPEDREFVERQGSDRLRQIYRAERTRVALYWVRRTSREIGQIMREHRMASRGSTNLQVGRELGLTLRYLEFRLLCGMLIVLIRLFGPHALKDLATHALEISQSIGGALVDSTAPNRIEAAGTLGGA
jgi:hypothetical protein